MLTLPQTSDNLREEARTIEAAAQRSAVVMTGAMESVRRAHTKIRRYEDALNAIANDPATPAFLRTVALAALVPPQT